MQETIIDPQSINGVIQDVFGSYENFVVNLIDKRAELENEKLKLNERLEQVSREQNLIKDVLVGFHGKKINGQFYDSVTNEVTDKKPEALPNQLIDKTPMESINDLFYHKRHEYNRKAGREIIKVAPPTPSTLKKVSLQSKVRNDYTNDIVASLKNNYLPEFSEKEILEVVNHNEINRSFLEGLSVEKFTSQFAQNFSLPKKNQKQKIAMV